MIAIKFSGLISRNILHIRFMSFSSDAIYNHNNPYVFNENYFENTSYVIYNKTTAYTIFLASFIASTIFTIFSTGLIAYLVLFKTDKPFKLYSKILLICAILNFYLSLANFCCQAVS